MVSKVVIVGGGICGLATAVALKSKDIDVEIYEKASVLREVGAGLTLWANGIHALKAMDLNKKVVDAGQDVEDFQFFTPAGVLLGSYNMERIYELTGVQSISIHRQNLIEVLATEAGEVHLDHKFLNYDNRGNSVVVRFTNGNETSCDLLLACDGFFSRARELMIGDRVRYAGYTCFRGVLDAGLVDVASGAVEQTQGKGAQFGILSIGRDKVAWYATANVPAGKKFADIKGEVSRRFECWREPVRDVISNTDSDAFLQNDIYDRIPISKWVDGRVLLLGDAAHPTTPNLGQGACQAIEDADVISRCLVSKENKSLDDALGQFVRKRFRRTRFITDFSRQSGWLCQTEIPVIGSIRDILLKHILKNGINSNMERIFCHRNEDS